MYEAAREGDNVQHSFALEGVLIGLACGALTVVTGGAAAVVFAIAAVAAPIVGEYLPKPGEPIATGAKTVWIGGKLAARAKDDEVTCHRRKVIAQGSLTVAIENFPASRVEDRTQCDGKIVEGHHNVHIGLEPGTYVEIESEVPLVLRIVELVVGVHGLVKAGIAIGKLALYGGKAALQAGRAAWTAARPTLRQLTTKGVQFLKGLPGKIRSSASGIWNRLRTTCGEPVDVASGNVVAEATDLSLHGAIPLQWTRSYCSAQAGEETALGWGGWTHSFDQWILDEGHIWTLRTDDGRDIYFDKVAPGESTFHRRERLTLAMQPDGSFCIHSEENRLTRTFAPLAPGGKAVLRSIHDPYGNRIDAYYSDDRLVRLIDTAGRTIHVRGDSDGRVIRLEVWVRDELQQCVDYAYHSSGELASVTDVLGHTERFEYDVQHRMTKATLKNGVSFYYAYDPETGRCVRTWGDDGLHTVELVYDLSLGRTELRGTGEPRIYYWDDLGMVRREETLDGRCLRVVDVDDDGYVLAEGVNEAELTRYEYDDRGNRTKVIDAAGNVTTWAFEENRPTRREGPDGLITTYAHDVRGTLERITYPTGVEVSLGYDLHGRLVSLRDGDRTIASYAYDAEHNCVREVDARGAVTTYVCDALGRPIERTDALGRVTRIEYDRGGQPIAVQTPDGAVTRAEYEPLGNMARITDALGQVTELEYGGTGVLRRLVQPNGAVWSMRYNREERLTEIHNPGGELYAFDYDETGRVVRELTFDRRTLRYRYNDSGHLASIEYPNGTTRVFGYDPLGNVLRDISPNMKVGFERDRLGRLTKAVLTERSGKVVTEFRRDEFGRVIEELQNGSSIRYAYDDHGRRVERVLPDGATTRYGYDPGDGLAYLEHDGRRFTMDRDVLGREAAIRAAGGAIEIRSAYDEMDRLVERHVAGGAAHAALSHRTWKYDLLGRVREIGDSRWGTTVYHYDSIGQIIEAQRGAYREIFQYDITGSLRNMLGDLGHAAHARAWDTATGNRLMRTESARYEYDACGRRVKKVALVDTERECVGAVTIYAWDERDRLREVEKPGGERVLFTYDAFGRRIRKEVLPGGGEGLIDRHVVEFLWDWDELAADVDYRRGSRVFVHEPGTFVPMLQAEQGEVFAVVNDHLGMPKELVDWGGRVAWAAAHSAWGHVVDEYRDPAARRRMAVESPFRLLGQYIDDETGLCYTRFRYFDADVGRWCSPDPLGLLGGQNLHQFDGSPTGDIDPLGLCKAAGSGGGAARSFFEGTRYTPKVLKQMRGGPGEFHSFPESVTAFETSGTVRSITGGDGVVRQMLEIPGSYTDAKGVIHDGVFQFIKEADGAINHRLFVKRAP